MTELRVGSPVRGIGCDLGKVDAIVIDPTDASITHVVVNPDALERRVLVPMRAVTSASSELVEVDLDQAAFDACDLFDQPAFNEPDDAFDVPPIAFEPGSYFLEPFASPLDGYALADHERIPKGEITIRRGDEVRSHDGVVVGHVDELLVDPTDGHVTHVVLREGHVLRHDDDVVVPIAGAVFGEGRVDVGLDLAALHELERIPVKRHGHVKRSDQSSDA